MKHSRPCLLLLALAIALPVVAQDTTPVDSTQADAAPASATAMPQMSAEQQAMMAAWEKAGQPGAQHQRLADQFAGTWDTKMTMWMDPSAPPMTETGKSTNTAELGGRQLRMAFSGQMMGQPFEGMGYMGYDNIRGKYTSSWMDNMSTGTMMTDGEYDLATQTYTFRGEMADPMQGGKAMIPFRETVRIVDADHHVMEMYETRDGKEARSFMIEYTRSK